MEQKKFDQTITDSQATPVEPVAPEVFDFDSYVDYEMSLLQKCRDFWQAQSGVLVYRRMRVAEVFSYGCRDMKSSLEWQLGGLKKSMAFVSDVPNFLEPWYGIGTIAGAFGIYYLWNQGQAPVVRPKFKTAQEALDYNITPVSQSSIGKHTLDMIDYFIEKTGSRLPMSLTDTQSPLNIACNIVDMSGLFFEMFDNPEAVKKLLWLLAGLLVDFTQEQIEHIDRSLVWPGHGFASCRDFEGLGMSDDNALMISNEQYLEFAADAVESTAKNFGGPVFHSCGNWSDKVEMVKKIPGLRMVDGAFSVATDPSPNPPEPFAEAFANTGIAVNARIVGNPDTVADIVKRLWKPGMKLIVTTYCRTPEEQAEVYNRIHEICR